MSRTETLEQLKEELSFIRNDSSKCQVYCRSLGYGYQLVIDCGHDERRIFIRKYEEEK